MKKSLPLLCAGLVTVSVLGMTGCNLLPGEKPVPDNDVVIEQYFDIGSVDFSIKESNDFFYPTLTGFFNTNIDYDKVTVTCAEKETDVKFIETGVVDGKMLQFNQVILYDLLMPEDYDVKFTVYKDDWKLDVDAGIDLKSNTTLTLDAENYAMQYKEEWFTSTYNGLSVLSKKDNTITLNGSKLGNSNSTVKVYPFTLEPGTYSFEFKVESGTYVNSNTERNTGFTIMPKFSEDDLDFWSIWYSAHATKIGDTFSITYVVASRVTVDSFYVHVPNDTSTFSDVVISWTY